MKHSCLADLHRRNHARFVARDGWLLPESFGDFLEEVRAVRERSGWLDLAHRTIVSFSGPDAETWLQGMVSNDVKALSPGTGMEATVLTIQGKMVADVRILRTDSAFLMDLWESLKDATLEHLQRYLIADEVEITDCSETFTLVSLQGPKAEAALQELVGTPALPSGKLEHRELSLAGGTMRVMRASHTGERGFDLYLPQDRRDAFLSLFESERALIPDQWVGLRAQEVLRIEAGIPLYGTDMGQETLLLETGLDRAVSFTKGCYLGQETVERIRSRGHVNRRLVGLKMKGDLVPGPGDKIKAGEKETGNVTSATFSPTLQCPLALAYVHRDHAEPGTPLVIEHGKNSLPAVLSTLPFYEARD